MEGEASTKNTNKATYNDHRSMDMMFSTRMEGEASTKNTNKATYNDHRTIMEGEASTKNTNKATYNDHRFMDMMFSWSIEDIFNEELYKNQVEKIELSFGSVDHYLSSFVYPLLEETRAQLCSSMENMSNLPFAEVIGLEEAKPVGKKLYRLRISGFQNRFNHRANEGYKMLPGDILLLTDYKPETVNDLQRMGRTWNFVSVVKTGEDPIEGDNSPFCFKVKASSYINPNRLQNKSLFLVFLTNISPNRRIWNALHMNGNVKLMKQILGTHEMVEEVRDYCCSVPEIVSADSTFKRLSSELNHSQKKAIDECLPGLSCNHNTKVKLIWGPPGTGKTKTLATFLFALMKMKCRVLVCAPTNVAIKEVATRFLSIVKDSSDGDLFCCVGDVLLFGNNERLKVGEGIESIYMDYRVQQLTECLSPSSGLRNCLQSMIDLLKRCVYLHREYIKEGNLKPKSFLEFLRDSFNTAVSPLRHCISVLCTHIPKRVLLKQNYWNLLRLNCELEPFEALLFQNDLVSVRLENLFSDTGIPDNKSWSLEDQLYRKRNECLSALVNAKDSIGRYKLLKSFNSSEACRKFCFRKSSFIFCTASGSNKLHSVAEMKPLDVLIIDEAAQLKECESLIALQLPGIRQAILVGDEHQLPSMVESNVSREVGLGRSLFERLSLLGHHPKHLLNIQHRMHPAISSFPNTYFYSNKVSDGDNVKGDKYEKQYLPGPMFGPYSFINISGGREEYDADGRSRKNKAEIAVVIIIVKNLHRAWLTRKDKLCVGIVSPYVAQVNAIQEKLGQMYNSDYGFDVNVKSIDGFQGGEQDIVILSTVRTNNKTCLDFISSPQRTNVSLTRARHCLWVLGDERALANNDNVWKAVILDAKKRKCFFNANDDQECAKAILDARKEVDQFDVLLDTNSILFLNARWKVHFSDKFIRSFKRLRSEQSKKSVISLLERLSSGWRPKNIQVKLFCDNSFQMLKQFKVESHYVICSIEIVKLSSYTQVLKFWDILALEDVPKLAKRLENVFSRYTDDYINRCKQQRFLGNVESPLRWSLYTNIEKFKCVNNGNEQQIATSVFDDISNAKKFNYEKSLIMMKFYCNSSPGSSYDSLEFSLPVELTAEQRRIILFRRSAFVLGRFGTGKTTVMTTKLILNEKLHHLAVEAIYATTNNTTSEEHEHDRFAGEMDKPVLHQLFVTLGPELCQEVKNYVSRHKRWLCKGRKSDQSRSVNDVSETSTETINEPEHLVDVPPDSYPLVVTFRKFLMMLDLTLGNSYFLRFKCGKDSSSYIGPTMISVEAFISTKEVNYERFDSLYWPHFNSRISKKLDSYQVFTEIMTHVKGSIQAADHGKLSREDYLALSESRASSLSVKMREMIYDIFESYEKLKMLNGEFDLADVVIDLHRRLRYERYGGDEFHFVYIDEVQDLSVAQISLFKHVCRNVEDGFVFCGDTAQTIGRGIDFRFQDVRSLFYKKFVLESKCWSDEKRKERSPMSDMFILSENFRTHAEVLKLSQSIIELLLHFFPYSVDRLKVETSFISGKAPIVFEGYRIESIFGKSRHCGEMMGGFGANQVILVRDNAARDEILSRIGKQALVLTILECKGLEFKDVLLYNFFASSPLKRQWGVIYEYMEDKHILDSMAHKFRQSFDGSKHNILCSELKQLYVAVTRTRNRLWIFEEEQDLSKPMIDYWKKKNLVQFKELNDTFVEAMKDRSYPEEWKERGMKLYYQKNYGMAAMCFEIAGDDSLERKSKAAGILVTSNI